MVAATEWAGRDAAVAGAAPGRPRPPRGAPWSARAGPRPCAPPRGCPRCCATQPGRWTTGWKVPQLSPRCAARPDAELILAQQAATLGGGALELGGAGTGAGAGTGTGPLPRALAPGLRALTPAGLALAASAELQAFTRARSQQRVQASGESMGVDLGTVEGVSAASWHAWAREQAWAGFAGVQASGPTAQVAGDAVGLFELAHPGAVGRAVATGEGFAALRAFVAGALEAHAAGRLVPRPDALARGWAEVFPALDEAGRRLGELPGFAPAQWTALGLVSTMTKPVDPASEAADEGDAVRGPDRESTELPEEPGDLLEQGWEETSHPEARARGHRTFVNPETGEEIRFDEGVLGRSGWAGLDHYHGPNPDRTGRGDANLDADSNPVPRGSDASHIPPGARIR